MTVKVLLRNGQSTAETLEGNASLISGIFTAEALES